MSYRIATNSFSAIGPANDAFTSFLKTGEDAPRPVILAHLSNTRELRCGVTATAYLDCCRLGIRKPTPILDELVIHHSDYCLCSTLLSGFHSYRNYDLLMFGMSSPRPCPLLNSLCGGSILCDAWQMP